MSTENFTGRAEAYAKGRPGYPKSSIEYIRSLVPQNAIVADIGAGTGKFTKALALCNYTVYAIEPNADMREQLVITLASFPNAKILNGTDKETKLPDHSVDIVTIAHALHWFELNAFREECRRILKPGGLIIVVYNIAHDGEIATLSKQAVDAFFVAPTVMDFPNPMEYTRDKWLAYIASMDNTPFPNDPGYDTHIAEINAKFENDSIDGLLRLDRVTKIYSERLS